MDVPSREGSSHRAPAGPPARFEGAAGEHHQFPDFSIKQLIARFILARGAVVRATNPHLADEYLKLASAFDSNQPGLAHRLNAWPRA